MLYLKTENVFLFLISKGILFQSLDTFILKDDLYKELFYTWAAAGYYFLHISI